MGISTDAILFYGYCWDEEVNLTESPGEKDWPELILEKRGILNPWSNYPHDAIKDLPYAERRAAGDRWIEDNRIAIDAWRQREQSVRQEFGVDIRYHCSHECPMPYVHITEARYLASRGCAVEIDLPPIDPSWAAKLDRFLAEFRIDKPHPQPRWWLVSMWG